MKLKEKVVIITGATAGIGRASAILFAKEGASVVAAGRSVEKGESLVKEITELGGKVVFCRTDVCKEEDIDNLVKCAIDNYGRIDALYNNAGIAYYSSLDKFDLEQWDNVFNINLRATFVACKKVMPYLVETKGAILNTSSISGLNAVPRGYAYVSSKIGVVGLTKVLALDYAKHGVRVNTICPSITNTEILSAVTEEELEGYKQIIPMQRIASSEEMAKVSLFMLSDDASYMTGQSIAIDGGFIL